MKLEWNIEEIKTRIKKIVNLLKTEKLNDEYLDLYDELIELCSLTYFINGSDADDSFLNKNQEQFVMEHYKNQKEEGLELFKKNLSMHTNISREIIDTFNNIRFHRYEGDFKEVSIKQNVDLIRDFLRQYDLEQAHYFEQLISNKCINVTNRKLTFYNGITCFSKDKSYILCNKESNINLGVILIHEFSHVYAAFKNNFKRLNRNENLSEINSHYMEYMFLEFLINNNLFTDDALLIQNGNYTDLYLLSLKLLILTSIRELKCDNSYEVINDSIEIRNSVLKLEDVRYDELLSFSTDLNLHHTLKYTYGNLTGLIYSNRYNDNPSGTKKELEDLMRGKITLKDIATLDGLEKQLVLNNKRMD